ncbi:DUF3848 domain-containing protein [Anaerocolumna aminovalerica]|uniref:DUF3848 domain-containing protein n=1 Tax=Anaerocolumna aminovalerica TaxID=1527 RepID=UPI000BE260E0|nr:DUF3848 domain-containing protein [Anaerocolumna aminovalerica]
MKMTKNEIIEALREKLDRNNDAYRSELLYCSTSVLIARAQEIAANFLVYNELYGGRYSVDFMEYLLRFDNPLEVVRDQWLNEQNVSYDEEMTHVLWNIADRKDAEKECKLDEEFLPLGQEVKMC